MTRLVLVGGGHSHVEVLRQFGANPKRGVKIALVSPDRLTPYSGMLPGLVAGHYGFAECHIDLEPLARYARAAFHRGAAAGLDLREKRIRLDSGETLGYDFLSLDIGSTPVTRGVPGAAGHAIPAKPVERLIGGWDAVRRAIAEGTVLDIVVAGGGAAGIELALAMRHRLGAEARSASAPRMRLVTDAPRLLETYPPALGTLMIGLLKKNGVGVMLDSRILEVEPRQLRTARGDCVACDALFWVTGAQASSWPGKSGVYAVRQAPVLARNLRAALTGGTLEAYVPQRDALALISTGGKTAVAARGRWALTNVALGGLLWRWNNRIDRSFMARYNNLLSGPT